MARIYTVLHESNHDCTQVYAFTSINKAINLTYNIIKESIDRVNYEIIQTNEEYGEENELIEIETQKEIKKQVKEAFQTDFNDWTFEVQGYDDRTHLTIEKHE